jgi:hypothetical protein
MVFWFLAFAMAAPPSANTVAQTDPYRIAGQTSHARHTHGGAAAKLGGATFEVEFSGTKSPTTLTATKVEYLTGHSCDTAPDAVHSTFVPAGLWVDGDEATDSAPVVAIAPGKSTVHVTFPPVEAYYIYCDFFAFRVTFVAGTDTTLVATAQTDVARITPLHR